MKGRRWEQETASLAPEVRSAFSMPPAAYAYRLDPGGEGVILVYRRLPPTGA